MIDTIRGVAAIVPIEGYILGTVGDNTVVRVPQSDFPDVLHWPELKGLSASRTARELVKGRESNDYRERTDCVGWLTVIRL